MTIKGLNFIQTCEACPEQYDVVDDNRNQVGYVRLRWGCLRCDYPDVGKETIYSTSFDDERMGYSDSQEQREHYLNIIADKLLERINHKEVYCAN